MCDPPRIKSSLKNLFVPFDLSGGEVLDYYLTNGLRREYFNFVECDVMSFLIKYSAQFPLPTGPFFKANPLRFGLLIIWYRVTDLFYEILEDLDCNSFIFPDWKNPSLREYIRKEVTGWHEKQESFCRRTIRYYANSNTSTFDFAIYEDIQRIIKYCTYYKQILLGIRDVIPPAYK